MSFQELHESSSFIKKYDSAKEENQIKEIHGDPSYITQIYESDQELNEMLKSMKDLQILDNINENSFFLNNYSPPKLEKKSKSRRNNFMSYSCNQNKSKTHEIKKCSSVNNFDKKLEINYDGLRDFQKNFDLLKIQRNKKKFNVKFFNDEKENKSNKILEKNTEHNISTKDQMINNFFLEKKKMEKKIKKMQIEKCAGKKIIKKFENNDSEAELNKSRKKEFIEKKTKIKKYENMKLKKYKDENDDSLKSDEDIQKLELEKKLNNARSKISIKTFLWAKTIFKPTPAVLSISSAFLTTFGFLDHINENNWKQMQSFFFSPSELLKRISKHEHFIKKCMLNQELINKSRKHLENFEEKTSNMKETNLYDEFIKIIYDFLCSFYDLYDHIFSNTKYDYDKILNTEQSTKILNDKENSKKRLFSSDFKMVSLKISHTDQKDLFKNEYFATKEQLSKEIKDLKKEISKLNWTEERRLKEIKQKEEAKPEVKFNLPIKGKTHTARFSSNEKVFEGKSKKEDPFKKIQIKNDAEKKILKTEKILKKHEVTSLKNQNENNIKKKNIEKNYISMQKNKIIDETSEKKLQKFQKEIEEKAKEIESIEEDVTIKENWEIKKLLDQKTDLTETLICLKKMMKRSD